MVKLPADRIKEIAHDHDATCMYKEWDGKTFRHKMYTSTEHAINQALDEQIDYQITETEKDIENNVSGQVAVWGLEWLKQLRSPQEEEASHD